MTIKVAIQHHTAYRFDKRVALLPHILRLRPAPHCRMPIQAYSLKVSPEKSFYQLATGSIFQLSGTPGIPRKKSRTDYRR